MNARLVHIPHIPTRYDAIADQRVPSVNVTPAAAYGELNLLLHQDESVRVKDLGRAIDRINKALVADWENGDFICCVGDPVLIGAAIAAASKLSVDGSVNVLRWDRNKKQYITSEVSYEF